jgi:hypothetical protein
VNVIMSASGLYRLQAQSEIIESADVTQRVTSEVAARKEMAAKTSTRSKLELMGECVN